MTNKTTMIVMTMPRATGRTDGRTPLALVSVSQDGAAEPPIKIRSALLRVSPSFSNRILGLISHRLSMDSGSGCAQAAPSTSHGRWQTEPVRKAPPTRSDESCWPRPSSTSRRRGCRPAHGRGEASREPCPSRLRPARTLGEEPTKTKRIKLGSGRANTFTCSRRLANFPVKSSYCGCSRSTSGRCHASRSSSPGGPQDPAPTDGSPGWETSRPASASSRGGMGDVTMNCCWLISVR